MGFQSRNKIVYGLHGICSQYTGMFIGVFTLKPL